MIALEKDSRRCLENELSSFRTIYSGMGVEHKWLFEAVHKQVPQFCQPPVLLVQISKVIAQKRPNFLYDRIALAFCPCATAYSAIH